MEEGPMPDLDDFDLKTGGSPADEPKPYRPEPEVKKGGLLFPAILALAAIAAIALLAVLYLTFRTPVTPEPEPTGSPASVATPTPVPAATATPVVLPSLDESDGLVRQMLREISTNSELGRWLAQNNLVRTITVVTVNIATGESPRPHLRFLAPQTRFAPTRKGGSLVPDPASFAGYAPVADAVASIDSGAAAATYRTLEPLFDVAFQEFGMPDVRFRTILLRAIDNLLAVPDLGADVELVPHATVFRYRDPRYEELSPAQKQFLRMGPPNVRLVKAWLREFRAALATTAP
jgi:hypothetical protein